MVVTKKTFLTSLNPCSGRLWSLNLDHLSEKVESFQVVMVSCLEMQCQGADMVGGGHFPILPIP